MGHQPEKCFFEILSDLNQAVPNHLADGSQLTRLTLVCEVIRYRLVQVRQNLKKEKEEGGVGKEA